LRSDHPRILFSSGSGPGVTVATFKQRCTGSDPSYECPGSLTGASALGEPVPSGNSYWCDGGLQAHAGRLRLPGRQPVLEGAVLRRHEGLVVDAALHPADGQRPLRRLEDGTACNDPDLPTYLKNKTSCS
jgi:hypothetical protein